MPSPVCAVELSDLGHQGVVRVRISQEGADGKEDLTEGERGREGGVRGGYARASLMKAFSLLRRSGIAVTLK